MRVAIVHYHLEPAGVTRVIENAIASLEGEGVATVVLSGKPYPGESFLQVRQVDGLGYGEKFDCRDPKTLAKRLEKAARSALGAPPDVWHFHNHALGKNVVLPAAVHHLAQSGQRLLLQIHDFVEDGRPANYRLLNAAYRNHTPGLEQVLYPRAPQIHYATLNRRDGDILASAGIPEKQRHILPNPVVIPEALPRETQPLSSRSLRDLSPLPTDRLFLYPTRAIRRKNVGEFIFWAALARKGDLLATTLAPKNPAWKPIHDRWVAFAKKLQLPVRFAVAENSHGNFLDWVAQAYAFVTTSIAEGFGLAFLEPSLLRKPLLGRNLPGITADFAQAGIDLSSLYNRLEVPLALVGRIALRSRLDQALKDSFAAYERLLPDHAADRAIAAITNEDRIDFGFLDESLQEAVITKIIASSDLRREIHPPILDTPQDRNTIFQNRQKVMEVFSLKAYGEKLRRIYHDLVEESIEKPQALNPTHLLNYFLDPTRFCLLLT